MSDAMFYPGSGRRLRAASSAGVVTDPEVLDIPSGGYSETFSANGMTDLLINLVINTGAATGDVLIEQGIDAAFSAVSTFATITTNTFRGASYTAGKPVNGAYLRLKNNSGQTAKAWLNLRMN